MSLMLVSEKKESRKRYLYFFLFSLFFLLLFRPIVAFRLYTPIDDTCYATWAARLIGMSPNTCVGSSYPPGAGILWFPASLMSLLSGAWNSERFMDVLPIWVGVLSFIYWCLSARLFQSFLFMFSVPVLYYATHRTTLVHAPEIFLASLLVWVSARKQAWLALLISSLLLLLRLNDVPALLFPLVLFIEKWKTQNPEKQSVTFVRSSRMGLWLSGALLLGAVIYLVFIGVQGYHSMHLFRLIQRISFFRLWKVLFGMDWGLFFTAPFWLYAFVFACIHFRKLSLIAKAGFLWMGFELLICIAWKGNGADFAYRYLMGSYAGVFLLWQEMKILEVSFWKKWAKPVLFVNAIVLFWLTWIYKEFEPVTPYSIEKYSWTQPILLKNAFLGLFHFEYYWRPLLHSPLAAFYYTAIEPASPYALSGSEAGIAFAVLTLLVLASLVGIGFFLFLKIKFKRSELSKGQ